MCSSIGLRAVCILLAIAGVARAGLVVDGTPAYISAVEAGLEQIRTTENCACCELAVRTLRESANMHRIKEYSGREGAYILSVNRSSTTYYDSEVWGSSANPTFCDGVEADGIGALIHELWHAYEVDKGGYKNGPLKGTLIPAHEVTATECENEYRRAVLLPERTAYGCDRLPASGGVNQSGAGGCKPGCRLFKTDCAGVKCLCPWPSAHAPFSRNWCCPTPECRRGRAWGWGGVGSSFCWFLVPDGDKEPGGCDDGRLCTFGEPVCRMTGCGCQ